MVVNRTGHAGLAWRCLNQRSPLPAADIAGPPTWAPNVVLFGSMNQKPRTLAEHHSRNAQNGSREALIFLAFFGDPYVDIVGVAGSIPAAPTIPRRLAACRQPARIARGRLC